MSKIKLKKEPRLVAKFDAFPHQLEAFLAVRNLEYSAIFHEQGLGKTKIAVDLMLHWLKEKNVDTVLFVVKNSLVKNWEKELALHTFMKPKILSQNRRNNFYAFNSPARMMLCHYEVLKSEHDRLKLFLKTRDVAIIMDESTKIKNPNSSISQAALSLAPLFKKRVIMTGTPVANRPYDIWAQIWFLDQGSSLGNDYKGFKKSADLSNTLHADVERQTALEERLQLIWDDVSDFSVRETKESSGIELPEKIIKNIFCGWERRQRDLYRQIQEETSAVILRNGIPTIDEADAVLKRLLRLVQTASNPKLIDEGYSGQPGKFEALLELVEKAALSDEKCIVWSNFKYNVDWITRELKTIGAKKLHGGMDIDARNKSVEAFLEKSSVKVLVSTPGAAKEGFTFTVANHVIFYDRGFSLDDYLQAQDRIHRISQNKKCYVYNLIMQNSIDEWVDVLLNSKHLAAQLAQGDVDHATYREKMSYDFGQLVAQILRTATQEQR
ncbi:DEAD/DEAH box helicase [Fibrobacterota bacterium]